MRALFALSMVLLGALLVTGTGWFLAARAPRAVDLSSQERQALTAEVLEQSPGVYRWAFFEPRLGFTLRPNTALRDVYGSDFRANDLGYRSHPSPKPPDTHRVLFVGDSWNYGMGVEESEAFPAVFERLAAEAGAGGGRKVQAWNLALPGYNTWNEVHALWYFFGRLQPDQVVFTLSGNDNQSTLAVLPTGSTSALGVERDEFGDPHSVAYHARYVSSFRYRQRWRDSFALLAETERRLADLGVPMTLFFLARWDPAEAHAAVGGSGLRSPYLVAPEEFTRGTWQTRQWRHASPAANRLFAEMVYRAIARRAGWPEASGLDERSDVPVFDAVPAGDWAARQSEREMAISRMSVPTQFRPGGESAARQAVGPLEARSGVVGRSTTILVRRDGAAPRLAVSLRRLVDAPGLYPLDVEVRIPSPGGGTSMRTTLSADGPEVTRLRIDVPRDLEPDAVLDVQIIAARTIASSGVLAPRSLLLEAIDNEKAPT